LSKVINPNFKQNGLKIVHCQDDIDIKGAGEPEVILVGRIFAFSP
jgi:hypothetical protein